MDKPSQPRTTTVTGGQRKRAAEACSFCRLRKIKCNNERPVCSNCRQYGKSCVFEPIDETERLKSRPRPSRVKAKEQAKKAAALPPPSTTATSSTSQSQHGASIGEVEAVDAPTLLSAESDTPQRSVSRIVVSPNGISSYHGRTSALFEDAAQESRVSVNQTPRMPTEWVQKLLVAEAAQQRQLEKMNYQHGKLDFDGVDPELGMHLLDLHWNRQHHSFLLTYRPAFMRDMACGGPYFSKILLNAIYGKSCAIVRYEGPLLVNMMALLHLGLTKSPNEDLRLTSTFTQPPVWPCTNDVTLAEVGECGRPSSKSYRSPRYLTECYLGVV
jgi:hypothetical protein